MASVDCAVVAFDLSGDSLLDGNPIYLQEGLTVAYGANGAGKSRLLNGIRDALQGVASDTVVTLVVRADRPTADDEAAWKRASSRAPRPLVVALAQSLGSSNESDSRRPWTPVAERELTLAQASAAIDHFLRAEAGANPPLLDEILDTRFFLLCPTGSAEAPSWDAWPVVDLTRPVASRIESELADERNRFENLDTDGDDYEQAQEAYWDYRAQAVLTAGEPSEFWPRRPYGREVSPRGFAGFGSGGSSAVSPHGLYLDGNIDFGLDILDFARPTDAATSAYMGAIAARLLNGNSHAGRGDHTKLRDLDSLGTTGPRTATEDPDLEAFTYASAHETWPGRATRDEVVQLVEARIADVASELETAVTRTLGAVLLDAPIAKLEVEEPVVRLAKQPFAWKFQRARTQSRRVQLADLSHAERAWATHAILDALYWHQRQHDSTLRNSLRPALYLLDEPEVALHRAAEAHMARSLVESSRDPRKRFFVTTHSPELLDSLDANILEVQREHWGSKSRVHPLNLGDKESLASLGLVPSDLLRLTRVFVIVEGEHDEVLLDHFLGTRLRASRIELIVQHGARKLPHSVNSDVLFDHTAAKVVGLVDNERAAHLEAAWEEAKVRAKAVSVDQAVKLLIEQIGSTTGEAQIVGKWLSETLRKGTMDRVFPQALEAADIVEYLPVNRFVRNATSWAQLHADHDAYRGERRAMQKPALSLKHWLEKRHGSDFTPDALRAAAQGVPVPKDMERLMQRLEALATDPLH